MKSLCFLGAITFLCLLIIWIRHRYIQWKENKKFWRQVDNMILQQNKIFIDSFKKALDTTLPIIIEILENKRKELNSKTK